ncbi:DUF4340 domain-containing protein [Acidihalobacter ferrooxydans]|nr:DUF4340 domain-containing protein [Acidihalobacter ferrooxydans]
MVALRPHPQPAPTGVVLAPGIDAATVRHITISRPGQPALTFARVNHAWHLTAPIRARANPALMRALLDLPQARSNKRYAAARLDLAQYGLAPPRATIRFGKTRIELGTLNPLNQRRYALRNGMLYLVSDALSTLPESPALSWISLKLLPPGARITALHLPTLDLRAKAPSGWTLAHAHASAAQIAALLDAWRQAHALRITPAARSTANTQGDIRVGLADGTQLHFQIIATQPSLILRAPGLRADYHLPAALAGRLLHLPASAAHPAP